MSSAEPRYCYRHPDRETGLSCSDCGRPICADCATFAPVGIRCPDHAGAQGGKKPKQIRPPQVRRAPGIALATGRAPVTYALMAMNVAIYVIGASQAGGLSAPWLGMYVPGTIYHWAALKAPWVADGGWYRLVTNTFLHAGLAHLGFNMVALWLIGAPLEQYLGRARYIGLYFVSGLAGSAGALIWSPLVPSLGASGAIFGVLGAMVILEWQATGRIAGTAMALIVINLVFDFVINGTGYGNISIGAHIGGLIGGVLVMLGYAHWRGTRAQEGKLSVEGVVVLVVVAVGSIAIAYFQVRGYA